jgi:hypothetical protein
MAIRLARLVETMSSFDASFRFDINEWSRALVPPADPPVGTVLSIILDHAPTSKETSDRSSLVCGYLREDPEGLAGNTLVVVDARSHRWRGAALADACIDFCHLWKPRRLRIEKIVGTDILQDMIGLKSELRQIEMPSVEMIIPNGRKHAKNRRIMRLQELVHADPPHIEIHNRAFVSSLFEEIEAFIPSPRNRGRQINTLDAISLLANFR